MSSTYFCCNSRRRELIRDKDINGIDYIEVIDKDAENDDDRQRLLRLHFVNKIASINNKPLGLDISNFKVTGGDRIREIDVLNLPSYSENYLDLKVSSPGDFSTYTLMLVDTSKPSGRPDGFDPMLCAIDFSFKIECSSNLDCQRDSSCIPESVAEPDINYLAKDYGSFREVMLSRISALVPQWRERCPADFGMALVELLAYVADYLSYRQDAIATEAYLGTARQRISLKRHARLVDYFVHDGCCSRVWVQVRTRENCVLEKGTRILTRVRGIPSCLRHESLEYYRALSQSPEIFETMYEAELSKDQNSLEFYTWGDTECCLPKGAIKAYLRDTPGHGLKLKRGNVLIIMEQLGPEKGSNVGAFVTKCHPVRLTKVIQIDDPLEDNRPVLEIEWHQEDSLPSSFCIFSESKDGGEIWSTALGNIVLADHGMTIFDELLVDQAGCEEVPEADIVLPSSGSDRCQSSNSAPAYSHFRPKLKERPITSSVPYKKEITEYSKALYNKGEALRRQDKHAEAIMYFDKAIEIDPQYAEAWDSKGFALMALGRHTEADTAFARAVLSARSAMIFSPRDALHSIHLRSEIDGKRADWTARKDLLSSEPGSNDFVVEMETDGSAYLRFGDGLYGARPLVGSRFFATYRVGNGLQGNIGARSLGHIITNIDAIDGVTNPMPAFGGLDPESMDEIRQRAPVAFRTQERAVTAEDYAEVAQRHNGIQKAAATLRWTGSWHTVFLTVDRIDGLDVNDAFRKDIIGHMESYRMAGHDIEVDGPRFVSLELGLRVTVLPECFRSDIKKELLQILSNRDLPDGRRGLFHPDNFTFGQSVYLSHIYRAAQSIPGIVSVDVTKFHQQGLPSREGMSTRVLDIGRLEIARLDNDPNHFDRGIIDLEIEGGR